MKLAIAISAAVGGIVINAIGQHPKQRSGLKLLVMKRSLSVGVPEAKRRSRTRFVPDAVDIAESLKPRTMRGSPA
jgi:hypothetical protein